MLLAEHNLKLLESELVFSQINAHEILVRKPVGNRSEKGGFVDECWLDLFGPEYGQVGGFCEHTNVFSGSTKRGEFPDEMSDCKLLKKNSAAVYN
jgi:hypothetical protein